MRSSHLKTERTQLAPIKRRICIMEYKLAGLEASYVKNWPETDLQLPG